MSPLATLLFVILWMAVGFIGLRILAIRYLGDPERAAVVAAAVVIAFGIGALLPFPHGGAAEPSLPSAATAGVQQAPVETMELGSGHTDVRAQCASAALGGDAVLGHIDLLGVVRGKRAETRHSPAVVAAQDDVVLGGWATDRGARAPARAVCLVVDDKIAGGAEARYGFPRPDIASTYRADAVRGAGFQIVVPASKIAAGKHRLRIAVVTQSGQVGVVPQTMEITVQ